MDSVWTITMQIKKVVNLDFEKWRLRKILVSHKKKIASLHVDHGQDAPITTYWCLYNHLILQTVGFSPAYLF